LIPLYRDGGKSKYNKKKPFPLGNGFNIDKNNNITSSPYAGIIQIRFKGCNLRLMKPPLTNVCFIETLDNPHMHVKLGLLKNIQIQQIEHLLDQFVRKIILQITKT